MNVKYFRDIVSIEKFYDNIINLLSDLSFPKYHETGCDNHCRNLPLTPGEKHMDINRYVDELGKVQLPAEIKEKIRPASKELVLSGIAKLSAAGHLTPKSIDCMVQQTEAYFENNSNEFEFDLWQEMFEQCIEHQSQPIVTSAYVTPAGLGAAAFYGGFMLGWWIAEQF